MKIHIESDQSISETEIIIRCRNADEDIIRIISAIQATDKKLIGIKDGATFIIERCEVLYAESVNKKAFLYTAENCFESPLRLIELEQQLSPFGFVRTGKASLVNLKHVRSIVPDLNGRLTLTLDNDERQTVSRQYSLNIKERLGVK